MWRTFTRSAAKGRSVRISDIRPRILLRQPTKGRFREAAPQRRLALDRRLWAENSVIDRRSYHASCSKRYRCMSGQLAYLSQNIGVAPLKWDNLEIDKQLLHTMLHKVQRTFI